jgi:hypothetical protein
MRWLATVLMLLTAPAVFAQNGVCTETISLAPGPWAEAISWKDSKNSPLQNPAVSVAGELLIGDASAFYGRPDIRTYFRFRLPQHLTGARILYAAIKFRCSYGGNDSPTLIIRYVDVSNPPSLQEDPRQLPLSARGVFWKERWEWKTGGAYQTPNISPLVNGFLEKYGSQEIVLVVQNAGSQDSFKGIVASTSDPKNAAQLIISYIYSDR